MMQEFERKFKAAIKKKGISQKEIAIHIGLTESQFSKAIKRPLHNFTDAEAYLIKQYTGLDMGNIMGWDVTDKDKVSLDYETVTMKAILDIQSRLAKLESILENIQTKI